MAILQSYYQDVYRSPVVRLSGYSGRHELASSILAYLDFGGATGTCKDGVAETMLAFATERGTLQPGMPVVEASSGSFGAALAVSCATTGHPCILVVPSSLPLSRRQHLQNLGARIVVCGSGGRRALEQVAKDTAARYNGYFTNYFANDDNPEYHRRVTGPQILKAAGDAIDAVVIGVGSGGTITGVAEYLKAWNSMIRIVAVEPSECAAISGGFIGHHSIAGIGPGFVPENYNPYVVDTVLTVSSADAERAAREVLFYDGRIHKLSEVRFEIPMDEDGFEDFMKPWVFTSDDNRFYMNFTPVLDRSAFMSAGVVLSDQHQVFGRFTGRITLDDGTVLPVRDFFGFAEKVENKW